MSTTVIVALDYPTRTEAMRLVAELGSDATFYKVGLQLLTEEGPDVVRELVANGKRVFLDLKLHEIPNSVAGAVRAAGRLGASMVTVHASAGGAVLRAAVAAAEPFPELSVLALTVITSLTDKDLPEIGLHPSVRQQVERLATLAANTGCQGVVASVNEASYLAKLLPSGMLIVTPGIQFAGAKANDQARTATPADAKRAGASHIVVGRPITHATSPRAAYQEACSVMSEANAG